MISAEQARYKSKYQKTQNEMLKQIEKEINRAINDGVMECGYYMPVDTEQSLRDSIQQILEQLGYSVSMPEKRPISILGNEQRLYDTVTISWK